MNLYPTLIFLDLVAYAHHEPYLYHVRRPMCQAAITCGFKSFSGFIVHTIFLLLQEAIMTNAGIGNVTQKSGKLAFQQQKRLSFRN